MHASCYTHPVNLRGLRQCCQWGGVDHHGGSKTATTALLACLMATVVAVIPEKQKTLASAANTPRVMTNIHKGNADGTNCRP